MMDQGDFGFWILDFGLAEGNPESRVQGQRNIGSRKSGGVCLLAAAIVACLGATAAVAGEVRIWPTAVVTGDTVALSDIADLSSIDPGERGGLSPVVVYAAPREGGEVLVRTSDVRGALTEARANLSDITFVGAAACRVSKARTPRAINVLPKQQHAKTRRPSPKGEPAPEAGEGCNPSTLEGLLRADILTRAPEHEGRIEIQFSAAARRFLELSAAQYRFDIHPPDSPESAPRLGLQTYRVGISRNGETLPPAVIVADVTLVTPTVVARRPINRGQSIEGRDLKIEERRFDDERKLGLTDATVAIGQVSNDFIRPGGMIPPRTLSPKPVVRRGDAVTIWRRGGVMIKTAGTAQGDGLLGGQIKVRRDGTRLARDLLDAIVTGPGTVELVEENRVASR